MTESNRSEPEYKTPTNTPDLSSLRRAAPVYRDGGVGRELWIAERAWKEGHLAGWNDRGKAAPQQQPTPTEGLPELTEAEFLRLSAAAGGADRPFMACTSEHAMAIARAAYQLGADVELEACCQWLFSKNWPKFFVMALRDDRRPKPPSLREQALAQLDVLHADLGAHGLGTNTDAIRRALEALPE